MSKTKTKGKSKNTPLHRVLALLLMGIIGLSSAFSVAAFSLQVCIEDEGQITVLTTLKTETDEILEQAGVTVFPDDLVVRDNEDPEYSARITVKRAFQVILTADGESHSLIFAEGTVADALQKAGITLDENDTVVPRAHAELTPDLRISVIRYDNISITADGETRKLSVMEGDAAYALEQAGITMRKEDLLNVPKDTPVYEGMELQVDRVNYRNVTTTEEIPYEMVLEQTNTLYKGEYAEKNPGECGEREIVTREKLFNGEVVGTEEISNIITKEPVNQVILEGTKRRPYPYTRVDLPGTFVDGSGQTVSYKAVMTGSCTAYTAPAGSGTATGRPAKVGNVAVNPNIIPYGTKMYICETNGSLVYGYAVAADTGGALMSNLGLIDLFFDSLADCYHFGRRNMTVYIL